MGGFGAGDEIALQIKIKTVFLMSGKDKMILPQHIDSLLKMLHSL